MIPLRRTLTAASLALACLSPAAAQVAGTAAAPTFKRNWTPPAYRIRAQAIVDETMARHPELIGITIHGRPPGMSDFTMFAATYHDRIGKVSGPDDAMALNMGRIMVETRYPATDSPRKVVVLIPLEDRSGKDVATVVFGFRDDVGNVKAAPYYVGAAIRLRDEMGSRIASGDDLFARAD